MENRPGSHLEIWRIGSCFVSFLIRKEQGGRSRKHTFLVSHIYIAESRSLLAERS